MAAAPVIESFDVRKDCRLGFLSGLKPTTINQLRFQPRKEAFDDGIVPTIPWPTHRALDPLERELLLIILAAAIRVAEQAAFNLSLLHRHRERRMGQRGRDSPSHGPAHNAA